MVSLLVDMLGASDFGLGKKSSNGGIRALKQVMGATDDSPDQLQPTRHHCGDAEQLKIKSKEVQV